MNIYIFGAGLYGVALARFINKKQIDISVVAFIDSNKEKQGVIEGLRCISIENAILEDAKNELIVISPQKYQEIEEILKEYDFHKFFSMCKYFPNWYHTICLPMYQSNDYMYVVPFNHYESPYPDLAYIHKNEWKIYDKNKEILDIDINEKRQDELLDCFSSVKLLNWDDNNNSLRYNYDNDWFERDDANTLFYMLNTITPKRIIEVGSGYSTAVMLDTNEKIFNNTIRIYSIEPNPQRLKQLLKADDNIEIQECNLQDIPLSFFDKLEANDVLFIDSSHVSRIDSDVNYIFFEILPRLKRGVYIHFHDIFYPFIYPSRWVYEGRAYNEMYLLRAFLMNNSDYQLQLFVNYLAYKKKAVNGHVYTGGGSFWIKKCED